MNLNTTRPLVCISVISHGQADLVDLLLNDLEKLERDDFEVIVTSNIPEDISRYRDRPYPLRLLQNDVPKGFGANHNAAFLHSRSGLFAIVNPDIRIPAINFESMAEAFARPEIAAVAPLVRSEDGQVADSARRFPTVLRLANRILLRQRGPDYKIDRTPLVVDWVGGMFVLFRPDDYHDIGGFDDKRFFMYMEDVDICRRLRDHGKLVLLHPDFSVIHVAQRASRRNIKHLRWHLVSAFRYLTGL